ncbi:MAG: HIT domain-containing protein [Gammaproteobacteria bacterium]|nr:HIT domain-containing protein [Gammaproteobacteria bacterium]
MAELHPQLQADSVEIGRFPLCRLLLSKDANYPWCILVPDRAEITEICQLAAEDQMQLMRESVALSKALMQVFRPDKLNIAALGNVVPQLHVHHIVRYRHDPAWPAPVWGRIPAAEYRAGRLDEVAAKLRSVLGTESGFTPEE